MPKNVKKKTTESTNLKDIFSNPSQHSVFARNLLTSEDHDYQPLHLCNLEQLDEIFRVCDKQVKTVEICCVALLVAVKNFKRSCCVSGVTDSYKTAMEECVTRLRETLKDSAGGDEVYKFEFWIWFSWWVLNFIFFPVAPNAGFPNKKLANFILAGLPVSRGSIFIFWNNHFGNLEI